MSRRDTALIVSSQENFFVNGIEFKLKSFGFNGIFVPADFETLMEYSDQADLIIYYMDDHVYEHVKLHSLFKDMVIAHNKQLILIGEKTEYEAVTKDVSEKYILQWFERPFDMVELMNLVAAVFRGEISIDVSQKHILIIDDDVTYMEMLKNWLKDEYLVTLTPSAVKALPYLQRKRMDLVLLDYEMPEMSGPEFLKELHAAPVNNDIPVMFLTGHQDKESVLNALGQKPEGYMLKPIDNKTLHKKLGSFFNSRNNAK